MPRLILLVPLALLGATSTAIPAPQALAEKPEHIAFFERRIRPILAEHCYECHSTASSKLKGGLALDTEAGWMDGGDSGEVIIPGEPAKSLLIGAISHQDVDLQMPPKYRLSEDEIDDLQRWVKLGAPDPRDGGSPPKPTEVSIDLEEGRKFWAFQKPELRHPPAVRDAGWPQDPIDQFILSELEARGLKPAADADRHTLIRRATFDLVGLPPSPGEIREFVDDPATDEVAFAKVVDRLLASPRFGERWGRHWLDLARYAESMGRTRNWPFPFAWRYRDYVIDAFNRDTQYDRFLTEQLAGDLLPAEDASQRDRQLTATGFLTLGSLDLNERDAKVFRADQIDEQIDVSSRAILGLTVACARCHDHKFDPIPTADYYALAGIFGSTEVFSGLRNRGGGGKGYLDASRFAKLHHTDASPSKQAKMSGQAAAEKPRVTKLKKQIATIERAILAEKQNPGKNSRTKAQKRLRSQLKQLGKQLEQARKGGGGTQLDNGLVMAVGDSAKVSDWRINIKGDAKNLGAEIPRGVPRVLLPAQAETLTLSDSSSGRLGLARWMTSPEHPLTSRVMVNRLWHHLFGQGIVRTVDNFGETGERPSNQALLDHLALRFSVDNAWSIKRTIREIMLTRTYRLSSQHNATAFLADPENRLHWRSNVRRLEAEAIRDSLLSIAGRLDPEPPEASPVRTMKIGEIGRGANLPENRSFNKRSVYLPIIRNYVPPVLEAFDFAEPSSVTGRRDITTVSTQALYMMNSRFVLEQAGAAASQLEAQGSSDPYERIQTIYLEAFGRHPRKAETDRAAAYINAEGADAWRALYQAIFASSEFRYLQ
ncbi:MAG: PSD1 and planctomycete cytochrome C domain-containing protein [Verrucomicrobiales bacterium]